MADQRQPLSQQRYSQDPQKDHCIFRICLVPHRRIHGSPPGPPQEFPQRREWHAL